jgi:hypothetical protein
MRHKREDLSANTVIGLVIIALFFHLVLFGLDTLNPYNFFWLFDKGDVTANLMGNLFFAKQEWGMPLLLNKFYGFNGGTLLFFSGTSVNGVLLKVINSFTGLGLNQLIGFWLFFCSAAFYIYSYRILLLLTSEKFYSLAGSFLLWSTPFFWDRSDRHIDLFGHWILMAVIYYLLRRGCMSRIYFLAVGSLFVSPYYLPMIIMLMIIFGRFNYSTLMDVVKICTLSVSILFIAGINSATRFSDAGFGLFKANLLTWVDSNSFSFLLPDIPSNIGENEGYGYIGLPFILLFFITLFFILKDLLYKKVNLFRVKIKWINLIFTALIFLMAISTTIGIGPINFELLDSKNLIFRMLHDNIFSVFRVTGRFIWVPTYLLLVAILCYLITRNVRVAKWSILVAVFLTIDNYPIFKSIHDFYRKDQIDSSAQVIIAGDQKKYSTLYVYPSINGGKNWEYYALAALNMGASTNSILVARYDADAYSKLDEKTMKNFMGCTADKNTLYYVQPDVYELIKAKGCALDNIKIQN